MSRTIDERVVEMRFDNKQFETNAKQSINTLSQLKNALNFTDASKSLDALDHRANSISLEGLVAGVQSLEQRFTAFGIVGMRIIENITDGLMNKLAKGINFVTDAMVSGGIRRAMNIENAHFQLQALLKDEAKVQAVMDDAMKSVDGTAYAYDEAAKAASQFAASGIQSGAQMQSALKGIVGVAAMTNSEFESISNIFTTVAGNGRLMGDQLLQLSSRGLNAASTLAEFVNGVNDGTKQTSDNVKAAVREISGGMQVTEGDIRDFVSKGKISFDIFSAAMTEAFGESAERANETFTGALSNMKSALARIGAGFISPLVAQNSQMVKLFNALRIKINDVKKALVFDEAIGNTNALSKQFTDAVISMSKAATNFVENADVTKPIDILYNGIETIKNISKGLMSVLKPISSAFKDAFSDITIDRVIKLSDMIEKLTSKLRLSSENSKNLHDAFKGVFDIIRVLADGFISLLTAIIPINKPLTDLRGGFFELVGDAGRALSAVAEWVKQSPLISGAFTILSNSITFLCDGISSLIRYTGDLVNKIKEMPIIQSIFSGINEAFNSVGRAMNNLSDHYKPFEMFFTSIFDLFKSAGPTAIKIIDGVSYAIESLIGALVGGLSKGDFNGSLDILNAGIFAATGIQIKKFIDKLDKPITTVNGILGKIKGILSGVTDSLATFQSTLKADTLKKIAVSIAILAGSLVTLSLIDSKKLTSSLTAISVLFADLVISMAAFDKVTGGVKTGKLAGLSLTLIGFATAVGILSVALKKVSDVDKDKLLGATTSITVLLGAMTAVSIVLSKFGGKVKTGIFSIIALAEAVNILATATKKLGELDIKSLAKGLTSVGVLLAEISLFMATVKYGKFNPLTATAILILAESLKVLSSAVQVYGSMDISAIAKGLTSVGVLLAEISLFSFVTGKADHVIASATSLMIMAKAIDILKNPMISLGNMSLENIGKGLLAMGGALTEIIMAMRLMPKNVLSVGTGMIIISEAMVILSKSLNSMSGMTWSEIARGLTALGGSLGILSVGLNTMKGTAGASAAMLVISAALRLFIPSLIKLSKLSFGSVVTGLTALAGAFTVVGVAGMLLAPVSPAILALSGALAILSVSIAVAGAGILALATGLTALAGATTASVAAAVSALKLLIVGVLNIIADSGSAIGNAMKTLVLTACDVLKSCVPVLVDTTLVVISEVLKSLTEHGPEIVQSLLQFIISIIDTLSSNIPQVVESVMNFVAQMFAAITQALKSLDSNVLLEAIAGVGILATMMISLSALSSLAPGAMHGIVSMGIIIAELSALLAAIGLLSQIPGLNWLIGEGGALLENIGNAIGRFVGGIVGGIAEGVSSSFPTIATDLSNFMINLQPFIAGASQLNPNMLDGVSSLAKSILLITASDILNGITSWLTGGSSLTSFGKDLSEFGGYFSIFANQVRGVDPAVVSSSANAAKALSELANGLPNSGGLAAKIMGDNKLSDFGKELVAFGPQISKYASTVSGLDPAVVMNSANAAKALSELANGLPNSGGIMSWFSGDNDLGSFGKNLAKFGKGLYNYYLSVAEIDTMLLSNVTQEVRKLISVVTSAATVDASSFETFISSLNNAGVNGVNQFVTAFENSGSKVSSAINSMIQTARTAIGNGTNTLRQASVNMGTTIAATLSNTINSNTGSVNNSVVNMTRTLVSTLNTNLPASAFSQPLTRGMQAIGNAINSYRGTLVSISMSTARSITNAFREGLNPSQFNNMGRTIANNIAHGIQNGHHTITSAATRVSAAGVNAFRNSFTSGQLYSIGAYAAQGLANGISSKIYSIANAAVYASNSAISAARRTLRVHSPSRVFTEIGEFVSVGLANGIMDMSYKVSKAGTSISEDAINPVKAAVDVLNDLIHSTDFDSDITLTPMVDLSNVRAGFRDINSMFNAHQFDISSTWQRVSTMDTVNRVKEQQATNNNISFNDDKILHAMKEIRGDIVSLKDDMSRLQVVMDTGALVGALTNPLDMSLGRQQKYRERGI